MIQRVKCAIHRGVHDKRWHYDPWDVAWAAVSRTVVLDTRVRAATTLCRPMRNLFDYVLENVHLHGIHGPGALVKDSFPHSEGGNNVR